MNKNLILISGAIVYKDSRGKRRWFVIKVADENKWEFPKTLVRKAESSARGSLRMMGEQGGMTTQVLEEAGRAGGVTTMNGKTFPQRHLYYLLKWLSAGEPIGFEKSIWLEYAKALRKLATKREQTMLRQANKELKAWEKRQKEIENQAKQALLNRK